MIVEDASRGIFSQVSLPSMTNVVIRNWCNQICSNICDIYKYLPEPLLQVLDGEIHFPDQGIEDTKRKVKEMHGCVVSCAEVVIDIIFCVFPSDID